MHSAAHPFRVPFNIMGCSLFLRLFFTNLVCITSLAFYSIAITVEKGYYYNYIKCIIIYIMIIIILGLGAVVVSHSPLHSETDRVIGSIL